MNGRGKLLLVFLLAGLAGMPSRTLLAQPLSASGNPFAEKRFLPVDEAFRFHVSLDSRNTLLVNWEIAEGYYLYQDKFRFTVPQNSTEQWELPYRLPEGVPHSDEFFGDVMVYYSAVSAQVDISEFQRSPLNLAIQFQGCSEDGLCYTLQTRRVQVEL